VYYLIIKEIFKLNNMSEKELNKNYKCEKVWPEKLPAFPEDFVLGECVNEIKKNQEDLIQRVRATFYKDIKEAVSKSWKKVCIEFPETLWDEHRKSITLELIERFGSLKVIGEAEYNIELTVDEEEELPDRIATIEIIFWK
jgi:hypothetical protein